MAPSKMAFFGAGSVMLRQMMKDKDVASLEEMIDLARELGVNIVACEMSMDVMGIKHEELMPDTQLGGVATFLAEATKSRVSLFI
jgi:peroxiredoxin family protein